MTVTELRAQEGHLSVEGMVDIFPHFLPPKESHSCVKTHPGWVFQAFPGCCTPTGTAEVALKHAVVWAE